MILLFSDYGLEGPYIGQVETVIAECAPKEKVINLMADAPRHNPKASSYLLASLVKYMSERSIVFAVVDPAVGGNMDTPTVFNIDDRWFVGPDNGLFDLVIRQAKQVKAWKINYDSNLVSKSFHGRDIYAPACAAIAMQDSYEGEVLAWHDVRQWPDDLYEIIYIDHFGNCMTGIRADQINTNSIIKIGNTKIAMANTFSDVNEGQVFWYKNSNGLLEIAVNQGSAKQELNGEVGTKIEFE